MSFGSFPNDPGLSSAPTIVPVPAPSGDATGNTDRVNILAALNTASAVSGPAMAQLRNGATYIINTPTTKGFTSPAGNATNLLFGVDVPPHTFLDINGAICLMAVGSLGLMFCNRNPTNVGGDVGVGIISSSGVGIIDGNNQIPPVGARSLIEMAWTTSPTLRNLLVRNAYTGGIICYGNSQGVYGDLFTNNIKGGGLDFGQPFTGALETDAVVGKCYTQNTSVEPGNTFFNPGNGVYLVMQNSTVELLVSINNSGGDKLDRPSSDVQIGRVFGRNNGDTGGNSGFKFQGGTPAGNNLSSAPLRCEVGMIHMIAQNGAGLFMERCVDCTVHQYIGEGNAVLTAIGDVWVGGVRDTITELYSDSAGQDGVSIRPYAVDYSIGICHVRNPNQSNTANITGIRTDGQSGTILDAKCWDALPEPLNLVATAQVGGGTFAGGVNQFYVVTYLNANGETTPSYNVVAAPVASGSVLLTWGVGGVLPAGVTGVKVYRVLSSNGEYLTATALLATLGAVTTFTDTGAAVGAGTVPTFNSATTQKMKIGLGSSFPTAGGRVNSLRIMGAVTNVGIGASPLMTAVQISAGPPWQGKIQLASEAAAAYTLNAGAVSRNLASGATLVNVEQVLRQVIQDLQASGQVR